MDIVGFVSSVLCSPVPGPLFSHLFLPVGAEKRVEGTFCVSKLFGLIFGRDSASEKKKD